MTTPPEREEAPSPAAALRLAAETLEFVERALLCETNGESKWGYTLSLVRPAIAAARAALSIPDVQPALAEQQGEALRLAREYVEEASTRGYDGTGGFHIRAEAKRRLALIDAALAASPPPTPVPAATEALLFAIEQGCSRRQIESEARRVRSALSSPQPAPIPDGK